MINIGTIWPEWKIEKLIGEGGFGKVYEASRNRFGIEEHRAVKVISIPAGQAEYEKTLNDGMDENSASTYYKSMVDEFVKEIALLSQLRGVPNIVVYDDYKVVEHDGAFGWDIYIMMELLTPLSKVLRNGALSESEVVKLGSDICDALSACHNKNILHRDIKIDNIFVSDNGVYKLGDFGIARRAEQTMGVYTKTGTESYMAPEVYKGEPYGKRADIYSLGVVLYRILNDNRDPFLPGYPNTITVTDKNNAMVKRMKGESLPLPKNADSALGQVILKACSYSQNNRFASAEEFKQSLQSKVVVDSPMDLKNPTDSSAENTTEKTISAFGDSKSYHDYFGNYGFSNENDIAPKKKKNIAIPIIIAVTSIILAVGIFVIVSMLNNRNNVSSSNSSSHISSTTVTATQKATTAPTEKATEKATEPTAVLATVTVQVSESFDTTVIAQPYIDGEKGDEEKFSDSGNYTFQVEIKKDAKFVLKIDGDTYYQCYIEYPNGNIYQGTYNKNFYSSHIIMDSYNYNSGNSVSSNTNNSSNINNNTNTKSNTSSSVTDSDEFSNDDEDSVDYTDGDNIAYAEDGAYAQVVD